jgi:hypothetical protein
VVVHEAGDDHHRRSGNGPAVRGVAGVITVVLNRREKCGSCTHLVPPGQKTCDTCKTRSRDWKRTKRAEFRAQGLNANGQQFKRSGWRR